VQYDREKKPRVIQVEVANLAKRYSVHNLQIEGAIIDADDYTYHFSVDRKEFLMLGRACAEKSSSRTFALVGPAESAKPHAKDMKAMLELLDDKNSLLRIRVRGEHEVTGFGKVIEQIFKKSSDDFVPIAISIPK